MNIPARAFLHERFISKIPRARKKKLSTEEMAIDGRSHFTEAVSVNLRFFIINFFCNSH